MKKALLTLAGFDPSGGAGATLDLKVFRRFGYYGLAVLTSVTVQDSRRVYDYLPMPPEFVVRQYRKLRADFRLAGIKIGMVGSRSLLPALETVLHENRALPVVADPVFRSSSGHWLLEKRGLDDYVRTVRGKITLFTPNLVEASLLLNRKIDSPEQMTDAAKRLSELTVSACLVKGGHLRKEAEDILYDGHRIFRFKKRKLPVEVHGTGCFLSSAILCYLVEGWDLAAACRKASAILHRRLLSPLHISGRALLDF
ncbi:MAG: hydroxymethylpyrimidine/phosphomethylpyrimidine kinase [Candidatus Saccharicenans sp.]|nr:hydroxymethylpyrimidine/phosphomethylpyrimidine kinase [Candidatus Saccharicenans sp.]